MAIMVGNGAQSGALSPVRADRHHRHRPDGQDRPGGLRAGRPTGPTWSAHAHRRLRRLLPVRRLAAVPAARTRRRPTSGADIAVRRARTGSRSASSPACSSPCCSSTPTSAWPRSPAPSCWPRCGVADHEQAIRKMPWTPILMVSGVTVLIALLEKTGGLDLFTRLLARFATPGHAHRRRSRS